MSGVRVKKLFNLKMHQAPAAHKEKPNFLLFLISIRIKICNTAYKQSLVAFVDFKSSEVLYTSQPVVISIIAL